MASMPAASQILLTVGSIAAHWWPLAVAWHGVLALLLVALWRGWRPSRRIAGYLLVTPLLSVGALAWWSGNPFNAIVFAALAAFLGALSSRLSHDEVELSAPGVLRPALLLLAFAWVYPHFLDSRWWNYLLAAPLGLIPCPTLTAVIALGLTFDGLGSRGWMLTAGAAGVAYGCIGVMWLGVPIDVVLVIGGMSLLVRAVRVWRPGDQDRDVEWKAAA